MLDKITIGTLILGSINVIAEAIKAVSKAASGSSTSVIRRERSDQATKIKTKKPNNVDQKTSFQPVCISMAKAPLEAPKAKKVNIKP